MLRAALVTTLLGLVATGAAVVVYGCDGEASDDENAGWPQGSGPVLWSAGDTLERASLAEDACTTLPRRARTPEQPKQRQARAAAERERAARCDLRGSRYTAESVAGGQPCVHGGLSLRIGHDDDNDGAVSDEEATAAYLFCGAHPDRNVLPAFTAPVSGDGDRLQLPLSVGLDLDGDGDLRASEAAPLGDVAHPARVTEPLPRVRWLAPCQRQKWSGYSTYDACQRSGTDVVALGRVTELARIQDAADIDTVRTELTQLVFGPSGLPVRMPDSVTTDLEDVRWYDALDTMASAERLETVLHPALYSVAYLFLPEAPNGELFLYHEGHNGGFWRGRGTIDLLLDNGFAVLALAMPLRGHNARPGSGSGWWNHKNLWRLEPGQGNEIRFFLEPAVVSLNHAIGTRGYTRVHTIGISGGGWTITALAAVDTRVTTTFAVAGSLPHFARRPRGPEWGDSEQSWRTVYRRATYLDLYLLGSIGHGRRFFQIANEADSCCFKGPRHASYADELADRAHDLEGAFRLWVDEGQTAHAISADTHAFVLEQLGTVSLPPPGALR